MLNQIINPDICWFCGEEFKNNYSLKNSKVCLNHKLEIYIGYNPNYNYVALLEYFGDSKFHFEYQWLWSFEDSKCCYNHSIYYSDQIVLDFNHLITRPFEEVIELLDLMKVFR